LLRGLDARIAEDIDVGVRLSDQPLETVCLGAGRALTGLDEFRAQGIVQG
jgi:actin-like ATPase involved in cell morphogenesis